MISIIRSKLSALILSLAFFQPFIFIGLGIVAVIFFIVGLLKIPDFFIAEKLSWMPTVWALMVLSFVSGSLLHKFINDATRWQIKSVISPAEVNAGIAWMFWDSVTTPKPHEAKSMPFLLGIGIFFVILFIQCDFDFRWYFISQALPQALIAWGAYALIIQAPWSMYLALVAVKRATQSIEFTQYTIEVSRTSDEAWERVFTSESINGCSEMMKKYHAEREAGGIHNFRIVEEEGIRQVRVKFN